MGFSGLLLAALLAAVPVPGASTPSTPALATTPLFRHYNIDQGLPSSFIYTVVQDQHGMIWVGTISGLARFDGTKFKTYRHVPGDASSLSGNDISSILADSKGRLWAGGAGSGLNLYVPATESFRHYMHDPNRADSLSSNDVMAMAEGRNASVWVGTFGHGLDHMTSPGHFKHFRHDPANPQSLASDTVLSLYSRDDGRVWVGTSKGIDLLEPDGSLHHVRFQGLDHAPTVWGISGGVDQVRAATTEGLFVVGADAVARRMYADVPEQSAVFSSARDKHGDMWLGTTRGLFLVHDDKVIHFPARPLIPGGQPGRMIWKVMLDNEGGLWIATRNSGLAYLRPDWRNFSHYSHRPGDDGSLSHSHVMAVTPDGHGNLWVSGGRGQLDKLDPATGSVAHFGDKLGPASHKVLSMARAGRHGLWLGYGKSLRLLDHGRLREVIEPSAQLSAFLRMVSNAHGDVYAASLNHGVYRVDRQTLRHDRLKLAFDNDKDRQTSTLIMHDERLWRASNAGVSYLPADSLQLVPVPGIAEGGVSAMTISGNDLWLVRPGGLEHYRLDHKQATLLHRVDATTGWPGMVAYSITVDGHGRVWLFAAAGLWRYDPSTHRFKHYGKNNGLPSPVFTTKQLAHIGTDTVFAGTMNGVIGFRPAAIKDHPRKPLLDITSILVRRNGRDIKLSTDTQKLHLRWDDRDLRITAHALSYIDPKHNHYRFLMTGFDPDWVDTGTRGTRELAGLDAGHYQLKVQAAGPSGAWAQLATPLTIDVGAPPWLRPWAWLLYALTALVIGYLVFNAWRRRLMQHHRVQMAEQQRHMAEQASAAKSRFLATLSHEIRTPMTGVLGMAELLHDGATEPRQRDYAKSIHHSGELLLKLVNDALDMARIEAGRFELEPVDMDTRAVLAEVRQLLEGQALQKQLDLTVKVDASVPARLHGDALRIKQIVLNLTNNAIKFTRHGNVCLHAAYTDDALQLAVSDTGPGISAADRERLFRRFEQADSPERKSGTGLGLAICHELVTLMHGHITLESTSGKGSRFNVSLPLPEVTATTRADAPIPATGATVTRRVLLVEDDATVARVIQGLLEARGHHVVHAINSLDALGELENAHFDVALLDLDLPGLDGYQLAGMIRQREAGQSLPIAAITARSGGDEQKRAMAAGMDAFARKPLSGEQLTDLLNRLCP